MHSVYVTCYTLYDKVQVIFINRALNCAWIFIDCTNSIMSIHTSMHNIVCAYV